MTPKREIENTLQFAPDEPFIGGTQFHQVLPKNTEPAWVIGTEQAIITKFIVIDNKRISVTLEDFRGDIEITIKKQEFIEEEDAWEVCEANIFTPIEIQALTKLLASLGSLIPLTQKTNSEQ